MKFQCENLLHHEEMYVGPVWAFLIVIIACGPLRVRGFANELSNNWFATNKLEGMVEMFCRVIEAALVVDGVVGDVGESRMGLVTGAEEDLRIGSWKRSRHGGIRARGEKGKRTGEQKAKKMRECYRQKQ